MRICNSCWDGAGGDVDKKQTAPRSEETCEACGEYKECMSISLSLVPPPAYVAGLSTHGKGNSEQS